MKIAHVAAVVVVLLSLMPSLEGAEKAKPSPNPLSPQAEAMTLWQARRIVVAGNSGWTKWNPVSDLVDRASFSFSLDSFAFDITTRKGGIARLTVDLKNLAALSVKCHDSWRNQNTWCSLTDEAGKDLNKKSAGGEWYLYNESWGQDTGSGQVWNIVACSDRCAASAKSFAAAMNRLRSFANDSESPLRNFTERATAWRALAAKPPLPDEVRAQRLLAEEAIKQKNAEEALNRYETGLELYPTWPQGRFNAALIAAELGFYAEAVEHMQAYLELVPDAQDAQSARDQIVAWQYRVKHPVQAAKP